MWEENLALALRHIGRRGGPTAILAEPSHGCDRRFLLEQLAVADLFMSIFGALLPRVPLFAYHTGLGIYAYLALGALALGTFRLPATAEPHIRNGSRRLWVQHL